MNGFYGDAAITVAVGSTSPRVQKLLQVTEASLYRGIEKAVVGNRLLDISKAIQATVEADGFSVVRDFVGHGIGKNLHEDPQIPNFYSPTAPNPRLQEGMVLALEPMVNEGTYKMKILADEWTAVRAEDLIRLSDLEPYKDIDIVFTGIRPGEKLSEDLWDQSATYEPTRHPDIVQLVDENLLSGEPLTCMVDDLQLLAQESDSAAIIRLLDECIPGAAVCSTPPP